jgi:hypothetical protein
LIAALRRAESSGHDPVELLRSVASARELATARSVSEVLAWRMGQYLSAGSEPVSEQSAPAAEAVLPWIARPHLGFDEGLAGVARYLADADKLITARVDELASIAARLRPAWTLLLGQAPEDPDLERQWLRHVAIIAAYRDQFKIATNDPRQVLGPYAEPGHAGHKAYWLAVESVLAARRLAGLDPAPAAPASDAGIRSQLAADVYRTLPEDERAAISKELAARLGPLWFGDRAAPDEQAAVQPAYGAKLTDALIKHGYLTTVAIPGSTIADEEPLEASLARRPKVRHRPGSTLRHTPEPAPASRIDQRSRPIWPDSQPGGSLHPHSPLG